jgi:hypothetical protein
MGSRALGSRSAPMPAASGLHVFAHSDTASAPHQYPYRCCCAHGLTCWHGATCVNVGAARSFRPNSCMSPHKCPRSCQPSCRGPYLTPPHSPHRRRPTQGDIPELLSMLPHRTPVPSTNRVPPQVRPIRPLATRARTALSARTVPKARMSHSGRHEIQPPPPPPSSHGVHSTGCRNPRPPTLSLELPSSEHPQSLRLAPPNDPVPGPAAARPPRFRCITGPVCSKPPFAAAIHPPHCCMSASMCITHAASSPSVGV